MTIVRFITADRTAVARDGWGLWSAATAVAALGGRAESGDCGRRTPKPPTGCRLSSEGRPSYAVGSGSGAKAGATLEHMEATDAHEPLRWDLDRLSKVNPDEVILTETGLAEWEKTLGHEDRELKRDL